MMTIDLVDLGRMDYGEALKIQEGKVQEIQKAEGRSTLYLVEHPPVLTLGRRGKNENILLSREMLARQGVEVFEVNRGGDVTYHGPGQLVGYPVLDLNEWYRDLHLYVSRLEDVFITLLNREYGVAAGREAGKYTGVYIGPRKITAIGIAVRKWISYHGFAFNICPDLNHFRWIVPCGLADREVTSLEKELGHPVDFEGVKKQVLVCFAEIFDVEFQTPKKGADSHGHE